MIVDHDTFMWFCTFLTAGFAIPWGAYEVVLFRRALAKGAEGHDDLFGAIIGFTYCLLGVVGVLKYHLGG